jgi:hypothetical protein
MFKADDEGRADHVKTRLRVLASCSGAHLTNISPCHHSCPAAMEVENHFQTALTLEFLRHACC